MILKWVIVGVLYMGEIPLNSKIFALDPAEFKTAADCEKQREGMLKEAADGGHEVWLKCIEIDYKPPKTKPNDKKSEVTS